MWAKGVKVEEKNELLACEELFGARGVAVKDGDTEW